MIYETWTIISKVVSGIILFLISLLGILPIYYKQINKPMLSVANSFSAGLLLSISLIHLMPESYNIMMDIYSGEINKTICFNENNYKFPWTFLSIIISYSIMLLIENIILKYQKIRKGKNTISNNVWNTNRCSQIKNNYPTLQFDDNNFIMTSNQIETPENMMQAIQEAERSDQISSDQDSEDSNEIDEEDDKDESAINNDKNSEFNDLEDQRYTKNNLEIDKNDSNQAQNQLENTFQHMDSNQSNQQYLLGQKNSFQQQRLMQSSPVTRNSTKTYISQKQMQQYNTQQVQQYNNYYNNNQEVNKNKKKNSQNVQSFFSTVEEQQRSNNILKKKKKIKFKPSPLFLVLIVHSLVEGLAIGLQNQIIKIICLTAALILHKAAESITLSQCTFTCKNGGKKKLILVILIYSIVTPIGIVIGSAIRSEQNVTTAILLSAVAGALLFISATKLISQELHASKKLMFWKYFLYSLSIAIISLFWFIEQGLNI